MTNLNDLTSITIEDYQKWCNDNNHRGIGGSDVAGIMGISKWASKFSVWKDRLFGRDSFKTQYMVDGINLEDPILEEFLIANPEYELADKADDVLYIHKDYPQLVAAIDAILRHKDTGELHILEIKTSNAFNHIDWSEGIPDYYYTQLLHYSNCTGINNLILHVSIREDVLTEKDNRTFIVNKDTAPDFFITKRKIMYEVLSFWNEHILTREPPVIDASEATTKALNYLNEKDIDITASFSTMRDSMENILEARDYYDKTIKELKETKDALDNIIKGYVGSGVKSIGSYKVTYNTYITKKFNTTRFRTDNEDLYNSYIDQSSYQRMTISKKKEKKND
jgi:putative phage-type endonuclease